MLAFVRFIFWFIQFALVLFSLCDARSVSNILVAVKVQTTVDTRQNITAATVVLIMLFNLSFPYGLTAYITNKRHHFHNNFCRPPNHRNHVEFHYSCAPHRWFCRTQRIPWTLAMSAHKLRAQNKIQEEFYQELCVVHCTGYRRLVTKYLPLTELHYSGKYGKLSKKSSSIGIVLN